MSIIYYQESGIWNYLIHRILTEFCREQNYGLKRVIYLFNSLNIWMPCEFPSVGIHPQIILFLHTSASLIAQPISFIVLGVSVISTNSQDLLLFLGIRY
jgi:hypothetical protein